MNTSDITTKMKQILLAPLDPDSMEKLESLAKQEKRSVRRQAQILLESALDKIFAKGVHSPGKKKSDSR